MRRTYQSFRDWLQARMAFCFCILEIRWFSIYLYSSFFHETCRAYRATAERTLYLHVINQMWNSYDGTNQNDDDKSDVQQSTIKIKCKRTTNLSSGIVYLFLSSADNYKWNNLVSVPRAHMFAIRDTLKCDTFIVGRMNYVLFDSCATANMHDFSVICFHACFFAVIWRASVWANICWTNRH